MEESANLSPERGKGDSWSHYVRRLAALAEAHATQLDAGAAAKTLLDRALALPFGFAGFRTQACLTLAEAIRVCEVGGPAELDQALKAAMRAAQNVQDQTFCALSTARVHAMRERWWNAPIDVETRAIALSETPDAVEFCPMHRVGEHYPDRDRGPGKLPSPDELYPMGTLRELATVYRCSLDDLILLNQEEGWDVDSPLPDGWVHIPDPAFAPLLAARFAAEALVTLADGKREGALKMLLEVARRDATAANTVASRLLLGHPAGAPEPLERVVGAADVQIDWLARARASAGHD